ncbi:unnamed protein product [Owenia fusiformis]|uniref:Cation-transporting ATPase n=1 Tax=Owenia fusiformis TaxID=6347 RepID=A0A8S4N479_OWEFU|nr:unnamed protein product [Owenia fusiformis]
MAVPTTITLNPSTDEELYCTGYLTSKCRLVLHYILSVCTLGLWLLLMYWKPEWEIRSKKLKCSINKADSVLLKDSFGAYYTECVVVTSIENITLFSQYVYSGDSGDLESSDDELNDTTALTRNNRTTKSIRYFDHKCVRYIWDPCKNEFAPLPGLDRDVKCLDFHNEYKGMSSRVQNQLRKVYDKNSIDIEVKPIFKLFIEEVMNPFYIFQIASITLWMTDSYYWYAACIFLISSISIGVSLYETRKQRITLRDMVSSHHTQIEVCRGDGVYEETDSCDLVPGDVIVVPSKGCVMACDAVLIAGNCIVNESMLTGESVPVTKTPLAHQEDSEIYSPIEHKRHTLFSGTQVIQTRYYGSSKVCAVVVRTGFSTAKGDLVRSILFPKPMGFQFYKDSMKFIGFLACLAGLGMIYSIAVYIRDKATISKTIIRALDIITIAVPPALPAAMTVGTVYAQNRLKKAGIFCISPPRINICGKLKLICFDKTGTLTEDGLDLWGVVPLQDKRFLPVEQDPSEMPRGPFLVAMASCHSLTMIDGELTGDPLDLKMFESTNWLLEEPGSDTSKFEQIVPTIVKPCTRDTYYSDDRNQTAETVIGTQMEVGIVRQFTFSSALQRMSVITRTLGRANMEIYCKGAPEKIANMCRKDSIPEDFQQTLHRYTMQGFRVIALAWKPLDPKLTWHQSQRISRDKVEVDLLFLGLIIMQNTLKPETTPVINQLNDANIRTVMVTGDNMLTAVSVARDCGMVPPGDKVVLVDAYPSDSGKPARIEWNYTEPIDQEEEEASATHISQSTYKNNYQSIDMSDPSSQNFHFAITGKSFAVVRNSFPKLMDRLCLKGTVFARMSPDQKSQLVEHLQDMSYIVGMCGDGANDCGALKAAHAGISLSEAEASVASPFTSNQNNIECVPTVIREGRAALVTSFGVFKYMALYCMVQFVSVLMLYSKQSNLGDLQFLYIDLVITTTVAILMGHTGAYSHIVRKQPPGSLMKANNLFSICMHVIATAAFQAGVYFYLASQPWFVHNVPKPGDEHSIVTYETTVIFCYSSYQYLMLAFIFSKGPPYRKHIWTNIPFLLAILFLTGFNTMLLLHPFAPIENILQMKHIPYFFFKLTVLGLVLCNFLVGFILEAFLLDSAILTKLCNSIKRKKHPKNKYKRIEQEMRMDPDWPPVGQVTFEEPIPGGQVNNAISDILPGDIVSNDPYINS